MTGYSASDSSPILGHPALGQTHKTGLFAENKPGTVLNAVFCTALTILGWFKTHEASRTLSWFPGPLFF